MSPASIPNPSAAQLPRPAEPEAVGGKLLAAILGRALGELPDEEKAGILVGLTVAIQNLTGEIAGLRDDLNELNTTVEAWDSILVLWATAESGRSFKSLAKEFIEAAQTEAARRQAANGGEPEEGEPAEEGPPPPGGRVIQVEAHRVE